MVGLTSLCPLHQTSPPRVWRRIPDGAEHAKTSIRCVYARRQCQGWLKREPRGILQPSIVVLERHGFTIAPWATTQKADTLESPLKVDVDLDVLGTHGPAFARRVRARLGKAAVAMARPVSS